MDGNKNHKRPHVHVDYGRSYHVASYAIDSGERLVGNLDAKYDVAARRWICKHKVQLLEIWGRLQAGKNAESLACELRQGNE